MTGPIKKRVTNDVCWMDAVKMDMTDEPNERGIGQYFTCCGSSQPCILLAPNFSAHWTIMFLSILPDFQNIYKFLLCAL